MSGKNSGLNAPESGLFYSPVFRAQSGKLPEIARGEEVIIWFLGEWRTARVVGAIAGGCYRVRFPEPIMGSREAYLSCNTYGGRA